MSEYLWHLELREHITDKTLQKSVIDVRESLKQYESYLRKALIQDRTTDYLDDIFMPDADAWEIAMAVGTYKGPLSFLGAVGNCIDSIFSGSKMKPYLRMRTKGYDNIKHSYNTHDLEEFLSAVPYKENMSANDFLHRELRLRHMSDLSYMVRRQLDKERVRLSEYEGDIIAFLSAHIAMGSPTLQWHETIILGNYLSAQADLNSQRFTVAAAVESNGMSSPELFRTYSEAAWTKCIYDGYDTAVQRIDDSFKSP